MIYLDNNATTPPASEVIKAITDCLKNNFGNPSSSHSYGLKARKAVEKARKQLADLIGASPDEIIFTSGGTEANNMAILGIAKRFRSGHIITSCIEHPAVLKPLKYLEKHGFKVTYLPVDKYGFVSPDFSDRKVKKRYHSHNNNAFK